MPDEVRVPATMSQSMMLREGATDMIGESLNGLKEICTRILTKSEVNSPSIYRSTARFNYHYDKAHFTRYKEEINTLTGILTATLSSSGDAVFLGVQGEDAPRYRVHGYSDCSTLGFTLEDLRSFNTYGFPLADHLTNSLDPSSGNIREFNTFILDFCTSEEKRGLQALLWDMGIKITFENYGITGITDRIVLHHTPNFYRFSQRVCLEEMNASLFGPSND